MTHKPNCASWQGYAESSGHPTKWLPCDCGAMTTAAPPEKMSDALIDEVIREVAELPDRTSPVGWPEAMLVTADELRSILREAARRIAPRVGDDVREALLPFAKIAVDYERSDEVVNDMRKDEGLKASRPLPDSHRVSIALGDCRKAKAALSAPPAASADDEQIVSDATRERLLDEKNVLMNSYGNGDFVDGLIAQRIQAIDQRLSGYRKCAAQGVALEEVVALANNQINSYRSAGMPCPELEMFRNLLIKRLSALPKGQEHEG